MLFLTFQPSRIIETMRFPIIVFLIFTISVSKQLKSQENQSYLQKDFSDLVAHVSLHTDTTLYENKDYQLWEYYLNRPHPSVASLSFYFEKASKEFDVPVDLLKSIAQVESNWTQIGPSIDRGWGIMHLVDNSYAQTLNEAAKLLQLDPQVLKDDAQQNIRGMAALIAEKAKNKRSELVCVEDWLDIIKLITGLYSDDLSELQVYKYYQILNKGVISSTLWGEKIEIKARLIDITNQLNPNNPYIFPIKALYSEDYPPAISNLTSCNFTEGRNHAIDTWVNHWIGTGSYAGAISWFHNCDAEVSAHFVIRSSDGEISQIVDVENTAWHCGASGYPYNNSRSIGVEHEATLANPDQWNSMPMLEASAAMASYFCDEYEIPKTLSLPGIRSHDQMPGTNTMCPGNLPWSLWMKLLDENFSEVDLVIMDMWTEPLLPKQNEAVVLFVKIRNVGSARADSIILDYRIDGNIIGYDSILYIEASQSQTISFPNYQFTSFGNIDYCVYIAPVFNEFNILNNSYCIDINVNQVFSISDQKKHADIRIFPNPCSIRLNFESDKLPIKQIEIYNLLGVLVFKSINIKEEYIDVSQLKRGFYVVKFLDIKGNHKTRKFQKE